MTQLSLVIPTFNESKNIPILLERLSICLKDIEHEVIIVDDNSPDETWKISRELASQYPWLRVIRRIHERGLSSAVLAGFAVAEGDYLAVMDADLQHDEQILPQFVRALQNGADLVVGSRNVKGGGVENWNQGRKFMSYVATQMAKIALSHPVSDPMSGFFAIRKDLYHDHHSEINPKGFKILLEFIGRCKNIRIEEIGFTFKGRIHGESKLSGKVIYEYIHALYDLSLGHYLPIRFIKYGMVGLTGLVVSYLTLLISLNIFNFTNSIAVATSIEVSIVTNFFLNNYWTFKETQLKGLPKILRGILTFHAICFTGALINQAIAFRLFETIHMNLYLANAIGYLIAAIWNYVINVNSTWKK